MLWLIGLAYLIAGLVSCGIYYGDDDMREGMTLTAYLVVLVFWLPIWAVAAGMAISREKF